jgi:hypothetical protein
MPAYDTKMQLKAAGLQAASTNGTPVDLGSSAPNGGQLMQFDLLWNAIGGATSTIDLVIEESPDQTNWRQVATFRQLLSADNSFTGNFANGRRMPRFGLVTQRYMRYRSVIAGSGANINFSLNALGLDAVAIGVPRMTF